LRGLWSEAEKVGREGGRRKSPEGRRVTLSGLLGKREV
jgi:hypothetical protein